jgi:putative two-component system response regulator
LNILIVGDDEIILDVLEALLEIDGHEVRRASNGCEAVERLCDGGSTLVISDWVMPEMDGIELVKYIRSHYASNYIYTILLTSNGESGRAIDALSAGADDFMFKPFDPVELKLRVRTAERILSTETMHLAIFALANLAEARSPETGQHLERIRDYSRALAAHIVIRPDFVGRLSADYAETIYLTSPLHDIGKVGLPDCVLLKPGRLNSMEFDLMKTHSEIGGQTLSAALEQSPNIEYLRMARDIALYHHEHYDGKGYPTGRSGRAIPLCARIVALADVYDALTSQRVYKPTWTHEVARSTILGESGTHFDPIVIEAFIAVEEQFALIRERFSSVIGESHQPLAA